MARAPRLIEAARAIAGRAGSGSAQEQAVAQMAADAAKVVADAKDWLGRLRAIGARQGLVIRGRADLARELEKMPDAAFFETTKQALNADAERVRRPDGAIAELLAAQPEALRQKMAETLRSRGGRELMEASARQALARRGREDIAGLLGDLESRVADAASVLTARRTLEGIVYRSSSGAPSLDADRRYSTWSLVTQAVAAAVGLATALLWLLAARAMVRERRTARALTATLPPSR